LRYARWLASVFRGELGYSLAYNAPVAPLLWSRAQNTLLLGGLATALSWLIALPLGVFGAARAGHPEERLLTASAAALLGLPDLLIALFLLFFAVRTGWFPAGGMTSAASADWSGVDRLRDLAHHLVLPVSALVLGSAPVLYRHVRSSMLEVLSAPFLLAARAHGIPRRRLLLRHALPAAANPLVSLLGLSVAGLLSASLLVEVVMSWPGLGPLLLEAILARDLHLVVAPVLLSTVLLLAGNLLADLLLFAVDPRIRRT
jgi:peptide/nickel transport system permease protein